MGFAHVQGAESSSASPVASLVVTLATNPVTGNLVCFTMLFGSGTPAPTGLTVKDSNNNAYTVTPAGIVSNFQGRFAQAYLLSAPANATKTITASWTNTQAAEAWADEFGVSGGTASFDKESSVGTGGPGTTINTPSVTPTSANSLIYAMAITPNAITSPTPGGTQGAWTGSTASAFSNCVEYDLDVTGAQAVEFIQSSGNWATQVMVFTFTASGGAQATTTTPYLGIWSKDSVLACGAFDVGIPIRYGLYDDDFVAQFSGTTVGATVTGVTSAPAGLFSKDATLIGAFDA